VPSVLAVAALAAALPAGGRWFAAAVFVCAAAALVELTRLLGRTRQRPLVPGAAVAAVGVPLALAGGAPSWDRVPLVIATALLASFGLALFVRRDGRVVTLSTTVLAAVVVGLGAGGLLVLRSTTAGFRWTLGLLLLATVPEIAAAVAEAVHGAVKPAAARVVAAGAIAGALLMAANPPFDAIAVAAVTAVGLGGGWAAVQLTAALGAHRGGAAVSLPWLAGPLLAAAPVSFVALALQV
jgi:hypothetical protein